MKNKLFKIENIISNYITLFLMVILGFIPLYMHDGYSDIITAKSTLLFKVSAIALIILGVLILLTFEGEKSKESFTKNNRKEFLRRNAFEVALIVYILFAGFSALVAYDSETVWVGEQGWYTGYRLILYMGAWSLAIAKFWKPNKLVFYVFAASTAFILFIALLNRFEIWCFIERAADAQFVSTLGNIGWFNGYNAVIFSIASGIYIFKDDLTKIERTLLIAYCFLAYMTGLALGGETVMITFASIFSIGVILENRLPGCRKRTVELIALWILASQFLRLLIALFPTRFNAPDLGIIGQVILNNGNMLLVCLVTVGLFFIDRLPQKAKTVVNKIISIAIILIWACGLLWFASAIIYSYFYNSNIAEMNALKDVSGLDTTATIGNTAESSGLLHQIFYMEDSWGSGRGVIYYMALEILSCMNFGQKLFGLGPDCMCSFLYQHTYEIQGTEYYGNVLLTNVHCEFLQNLICLGIIGTISFYGVIATFMKKCYDNAKEKPVLATGIMMAFSYMMYNTLNYATIYNYPAFMLLMGMFMAVLQKKILK